jgi:hypothetical protein
MAQNKFLSDFLSMRKQLHTTVAPPPAVSSSKMPTPAVSSNKSNKKGKPDSLTQMEAPQKEITLAYIIEKKPKKDKVIEYLEGRAKELTSQLEL